MDRSKAMDRSKEFEGVVSMFTGQKGSMAMGDVEAASTDFTVAASAMSGRFEQTQRMIRRMETL